MKKKITKDSMRAEYDFSKMKAVRNPYYARLKEPITIRLDVPTVDYFKRMADDLGMPYQSLINLYLRHCAQHRKKLRMKWAT